MLNLVLGLVLDGLLPLQVTASTGFMIKGRFCSLHPAEQVRGKNTCCVGWASADRRLLPAHGGSAVSNGGDRGDLMPLTARAIQAECFPPLSSAITAGNRPGLNGRDSRRPGVHARGQQRDGHGGYCPAMLMFNPRMASALRCWCRWPSCWVPRHRCCGAAHTGRNRRRGGRTGRWPRWPSRPWRNRFRKRRR